MYELQNLLFCEKLLFVLTSLEKENIHKIRQGLIIRLGSPVGDEIFIFLKDNEYLIREAPGEYKLGSVTGLKALCKSSLENSKTIERDTKENRIGNIIIIILSLISVIIALIALLKS